MIYCAASTRGFYDSKFNTEIPSDAVEITAEIRAQLLAAEAVDKRIIPDESGHPMLAPRESAPSIAPSLCTRRQGRLALHDRGWLDDVEDAIAAIPDPIERRSAQIEYEADTWERSNPVVQAMWAQLGGTPEGLDELFKVAVTL